MSGVAVESVEEIMLKCFFSCKLFDGKVGKVESSLLGPINAVFGS